MNLGINNNYQSRTNFGSKIKIIKKGDKTMHYGSINYLGLMDYFKQGLKPLNKEVKAKKLDIMLGSDNKLNPYNSDYYNINMYVGKAQDKYASVNPGGHYSISGGGPSKESTKQAIDKLFEHIKTYIDAN